MTGSANALSPAERLALRDRELSVIGRISEGLNRASDVEAALEGVLAHVAELLGLRSAWVWLLDGEGRPYLAASCHLPPFLREPARMDGRLCRCLDAFARGGRRARRTSTSWSAAG